MHVINTSDVVKQYFHACLNDGNTAWRIKHFVASDIKFNSYQRCLAQFDDLHVLRVYVF